VTRVAEHFLTERHRHRVLQLRTAHLHDPRERDRLLVKRRDQFAHRGVEPRRTQ
jgi:hypothetical protein